MAAPETIEDQTGASAPDDAATESSSTALPEDRAALPLVLLRDVALGAALLSLFAAAEAWSATSGLAIAGWLATLDGFLVGVGVGALVHEWGHFAGARWAGGIAPLRPIGSFLPIFDYDYTRNDARAFAWMSLGGNVGHVAVVLVLLAALPLDTLGTCALLSGAFGFAVFSSLVEIPVIRRARNGMPPLEALAGIPKDFVKRYLPWSIGAGLVLFVLL